MRVEPARSRSPQAVVATTTAMPRRFLVLGLGNVLLGDDGVGIRLVERLRALDPFPGTEYVDGGTLSFSLLVHFDPSVAMIVVDAAGFDAAPGTIRVYEDEAMDRYLASPRHRRSVHEVGLSELLDMARLQDCLPRCRALVCVQPAHVGWSEALSEPVVGALSAAQAQVVELLQRWSRQS